MTHKLIATFVVLATTAFAQPGAYKSEYDRLQKDFEAATKQALDPIQKRQATALQQLIRKASQAGDLETAVKAKEELDRLSPPATSPPGTKSAVAGASKREALKAKLLDTTWTVYEDGKKLNTVTFNADGTTSGRYNTGKWEVSTGTTFKLIHLNETAECTLNESKNEITVPVWRKVFRKE